MPIFRKLSLLPLCGVNQVNQRKPIQAVESPVLIHHHLVLDLNRPTQDATQQVVELVEETLEDGQKVQNLVIVIDITSSPDLVIKGHAKRLAQSVLSTLDQQYPGLRDRFVGISDDERRLPLRDLMRTGALAWEEIDNQHLFVFE
jgi:hypothetical protein